jgi:hypothetical protein
VAQFEIYGFIESKVVCTLLQCIRSATHILPSGKRLTIDIVVGLFGFSGHFANMGWVGDHCESNELSLLPGQTAWTGGSEQFCSDGPLDYLI